MVFITGKRADKTSRFYRLLIAMEVYYLLVLLVKYGYTKLGKVNFETEGKVEKDAINP